MKKETVKKMKYVGEMLYYLAFLFMLFVLAFQVQFTPAAREMWAQYLQIQDAKKSLLDNTSIQQATRQ